MGSKAPSVPAQSATEMALQEAQKRNLDLQSAAYQRTQKEQELTMKYLYEQQGLEPEYDQTGNMTGFKKNARGQTLDEIAKLTANRQLAALQGNLPVDPALERNLGEGEKAIRERLFRQYGSGWETSTPGIDTMARYGESANIARDASRRGDMTTMAQLGLAGGAQSFGQLFGSPDRYLAGAAGMGQAAAGYGNAASLLQSNRLAQYQGALSAYGSSQASNAALGKGIGTLIGTGIGAFGGPMGMMAGGTLGGMLGGGVAGGEFFPGTNSANSMGPRFY